MQIEDLIWRQASETLFITREQYLDQLRAYSIEPVQRDGVLVGAVLRKGPEFHFTTFGTGLPITRAMIRDCLAPQLAEYGYVETRTPKLGHDRQHRLNGKLGFVRIGEDEYNVLYRLDRGRSAERSTPCP